MFFSKIYPKDIIVDDYRPIYVSFSESSGEVFKFCSFGGTAFWIKLRECSPEKKSCEAR